jgi:hypothetical protein
MPKPARMATTTRRDALKAAAYVAPVILTWPVVPSFASAGSANSDDKRNDTKKGKRKRQEIEIKDPKQSQGIEGRFGA